MASPFSITSVALFAFCIISPGNSNSAPPNPLSGFKRVNSDSVFVHHILKQYMESLDHLNHSNATSGLRFRSGDIAPVGVRNRGSLFPFELLPSRQSHSRSKATDHVGPLFYNLNKEFRANRSPERTISGFVNFNQFQVTEPNPVARNTNFIRASPSSRIITQESLHPKSKPFIAFSLTSNRSLFQFDVDPETKGVYYLNIVVERMRCGLNGGVDFPHLEINREVMHCIDKDYSSDNFQSVDHFKDGATHFNVSAVGDWSNMSASLVVTIYYETANCQQCQNRGHFCCGGTTGRCYSSHNLKRLGGDSSISEPDPRQSLFRCIPEKDEYGSSLRCNNHPNCGFYCNLDELVEMSCKKEDDGDEGNEDHEDSSCDGYTCRDYQEDRFLITILLLIIFCVFVPFVVFLLFCTRQEFREGWRNRGRCPVALEILFCPFSVSPDSEIPSSQGTPSGGRGRVVARRGAVRRAEEVRNANARQNTGAPGGTQNLGYFDDLPPPYSECCHNKVVYPPPYSVMTPPARRLEPITPTAVGQSTVFTVELQLQSVSSRVEAVPNYIPIMPIAVNLPLETYSEEGSSNSIQKLEESYPLSSLKSSLPNTSESEASFQHDNNLGDSSLREMDGEAESSDPQVAISSNAITASNTTLSSVSDPVDVDELTTRSSDRVAENV